MGRESQRWTKSMTIGACALGLLLGASLGHAQDLPKEETDDGGAARTAAQLKQDADKRFDALRLQCAEVVQDYEQVLERRIDELVKGNMTLKRLRETGIFDSSMYLDGLPEDPIDRLPWLVKTVNEIDQRAAELAVQFGGAAKEHNERVAISILKSIDRAQRQYREEDRDGNAILDYAGTIDLLAKARVFESAAKNGYVANGYVFEVTFGDVLLYSAEAHPEHPGETGDRFFRIDQSGEIRFERGKRATRKSQLVPQR